MSRSARGRRPICAAVLLALVAGACAAPQPLPTYNVRPDASVAGALLIGTLTRPKGSPCIQVKPRETGR